MPKSHNLLPVFCTICTIFGAAAFLPVLADDDDETEVVIAPRDFYKQGVELNKIGMPEQSRHSMNSAIRLDPSGSKGVVARRYIIDYLPRYPVTVEAAVVNNQARHLDQAKRIEDAVETFEKCIEAHPFFEYPYINLSGIFYAQKNYANAAKYAKDALAINPNHVPAWLKLGQALEKTGDASGAHHAFARANQLDPENEEAKAALKRNGK